ncbi:hypothetical protein [Cellulomonas endophytica]|uniref:hypothetical protein n=1 Tax=Cellulomonas endophytica TaxID=2494735 RepID=UPI0010137A59|nr:hypothetical protein [Cellulomonas endophytica]
MLDHPATTSVPTLRAGTFRLQRRDDRWTWSDGMFAVHGFAPGEVVPTTELLLHHTAPAVRSRLATLLAFDAPLETFVSVHTLRDARARDRVVALLVDREGEDDEVLVGVLVDLTDHARRVASVAAGRAIEHEVAGTAAVDQAVGVVAAATGLPVDAAEAALRAWAQSEGQDLALAAGVLRSLVVAGGPDAVREALAAADAAGDATAGDGLDRRATG